MVGICSLCVGGGATKLDVELYTKIDMSDIISTKLADAWGMERDHGHLNIPEADITS